MNFEIENIYTKNDKHIKQYEYVLYSGRLLKQGIWSCVCCQEQGKSRIAVASLGMKTLSWSFTYTMTWRRRSSSRVFFCSCPIEVNSYWTRAKEELLSDSKTKKTLASHSAPAVWLLLFIYISSFAIKHLLSNKNVTSRILILVIN